ncbi:MAG: amino acid adenylation domain-containing protein [Flammeovirgaceae bacterium]
MNKRQLLELLKKTKSEGLKVALKGNDLTVKLAKGVTPNQETLAALKANKEAIIHLLSEYQKPTSIAAFIANRKTSPDKIPLAYGQERLWFIAQQQTSTNYHLPFALEIKGEFESAIIERAFRQMIERHEILRTIILDEDGRPYQSLIPANNWQLVVKQLAHEDALAHHIQEVIALPFDLEADFMLKAYLFKLSEQHAVLVMVFHHIASDGGSMPIILHELTTFYKAHVLGETATVAPLPIQYKDYAQWQREYLQGEVLRKKLDFWEEMLQDIPSLQLPKDAAQRNGNSGVGTTTRIQLSSALSEDLKRLSKQEGVTLFMLLLACYQVLLYRYSGQHALCVGCPSSARNHSELENLIGFFVHTLPLPARLEATTSFLDFLSTTKQTVVDAYKYQDVPLEKIVDRLMPQRELHVNPLFQVMFSVENKAEGTFPNLHEATLAPYAIPNNTSKVDIHCTVSELATHLTIEFEYNSHLFEASTIQRMLAHFEQLLKSMVARPKTAIGQLTMLTPYEQEQLVNAFNQTELPYSSEISYLELFKERVQQQPNQVALIHGDTQVTYQELYTHANRLAVELVRLGVQQGDLVSVCLERTPTMVASLLSVWMVGAAYVPIDPNYPAERISFMIQDSEAKVVMSEQAYQYLFEQKTTASILLTDQLEKSAQEVREFSSAFDSSQKAYVIYTSGSTGRPKGVVITQKNLLAFIHWAQHEFKHSDFKTVFAVTSICFDLSIFELFYPLTIGKQIRLLQNALDIPHWLAEDERVLLNTVPSVINTLLAEEIDFSQVTVLNMAGEPIPLKVVQQLDLKRIETRNLYGPSEDTTYSTVYRIREAKPPLIGKPIGNTQVYLLDAANQLVPQGVVGELCLAGDGVAAGYLHREKLTAERFITNPFDADKNPKIYKTGDLARWLPDGNLAYIGRKDDQVKVNGYRIELGEIGHSIQQHDTVNQCIVIAADLEKGNKQLVAYIIPNEKYVQEELLLAIKAQLPHYMVPSIIVELEAFPLTPNGKVNKKALPLPEAILPTQQYQAPRNAVEEQLCDIWQQLLHAERVGIYDNFFELGGDSIITIQVVSRAKRLGLQLHPNDIFKYQTVAELADWIGQQNQTILGEQGLLEGVAPLLPIQAQFLQTEAESLNHYNQAVLFKVAKKVTASQLQLMIEALVQQHDALRFRYQKQDGDWLQTYTTHLPELQQVDAAHITEGALSAHITATCAYYQASLAIETGTIMQAVWIKTPDVEQQNRLFLVVHHLAIDGVSWRIILEDLAQAYQQIQGKKAIDLGAKSTSYREWGEALQSYANTAKVQAEIPYWTDIQSAYLPLPVDFQSPTSFYKDTKSIDIQLSEALTRDLVHQVHHAYGTEINDLLLTALLLSISDWSGQSSLVIGLEGHGRELFSEKLDVSNTVGWFTSLYPVLLSKAGAATLSETIRGVKEQLRGIPQKGLGYGALCQLTAPSNRIEPAKWDVVFNYLGQLDNLATEESILEGAEEARGNDIGQALPWTTRLEINSSISGGQLTIYWTFSQKDYTAATIQALAEQYINILGALVEHCKTQTKQIASPVDFGLSGFCSIQELDHFLAEAANKDLLRVYPLSPLQEGMLFHNLYEEQGVSYIEQFSCKLTHEVNITYLLQAWEAILQKHTILRSRFLANQFAKPVQCVHQQVKIPFMLLDWSEEASEKKQEKWLEYLQQDKAQGIELTEVPLMRLSLIKWGEHTYKMLWTYHHILLDGWSTSIVLGELFVRYEELINGKRPVIGEIDAFENHIRYLAGIDKWEEKAYWENYLSGFETPSLLPQIEVTADRNKAVGTIELEKINAGEGLTQKLIQFTQKNHLTINTLVQGAWAMLLSKYTSMQDVLFGVTVSGRPALSETAQHGIGLYINTIPLRAQVESELLVTDWLKKQQEQHTASRVFQYTSLSEVQAWAGLSEELFDSLLVFENYPIDEALSDNYRLQMSEPHFQEHTNYALTIAAGLSGTLQLELHYNSLLLSSDQVKTISSHFLNAFQQLIEPNKKVGEVDILSAEEKDKLLHGVNASQTDFPDTETIVSMFEKSVAAAPTKAALGMDGSSMTYQSLNEKSNQLAHYLVAQGLAAESLVGISMHRSMEMIIAVLAVLKAGGAYVPIDPNYPKERIQYMIEDAEMQLVLTQKDCHEVVASVPNESLIIIDQIASQLTNYSTANLTTAIQPTDLAYVIYTSGSTGKPKGVMVEHRSTINLALAQIDAWKVTANTRELQFASFSFDAAVSEMFTALFAQAKLVLIRKEVIDDLVLFVDYLQQEQVTLATLPPSYLAALTPQQLTSLQTLVTAGEAANASVANTFSKQLHYFNAYGPTECTVCISMHQVHTDEHQRTIPIGKPIANTQVYLLDQQHQLVPDGMVGELCVGGAGLARGYLKRPALTSQCFIPNPYGKGRLYKTGDLAKWLPNGELEYIGRKDQQVKVRGHRVELLEVELALLEIPTVQSGVVLAQEDHGSKQLVAYVVTNETFDSAIIQARLREKLPNYMIPALLVHMDKLPLTPNGKIDKKQLPKPTFQRELIASRNGMDSKVKVIWVTLFKHDQLSIEDDFFKLGGHSLLVTRLSALFLKELAVNIPVKKLYELTTIADQSDYLRLLTLDTQVDVADDTEVDIFEL